MLNILPFVLFRNGQFYFKFDVLLPTYWGYNLQKIELTLFVAKIRSVNIFDYWLWAVALAQLVDQSILTPEVRGSGPVISHCFLFTVLKSRKNKKSHF